MNLPVMHLSSQAVALRMRENQWDILSGDIDNLILDRRYPLDVSEFLKCLQASLTKRQGFIDGNSQEHKNIQQDVNVLEALITSMQLNHESDGLIQRTEKLEQLKIAIARLKVAP